MNRAIPLFSLLAFITFSTKNFYLFTYDLNFMEIMTYVCVCELWVNGMGRTAIRMLKCKKWTGQTKTEIWRRRTEEAKAQVGLQRHWRRNGENTSSLFSCTNIGDDEPRPHAAAEHFTRAGAESMITQPATLPVTHIVVCLVHTTRALTWGKQGLYSARPATRLQPNNLKITRLAKNRWLVIPTLRQRQLHGYFPACFPAW